MLAPCSVQDYSSGIRIKLISLMQSCDLLSTSNYQCLYFSILLFCSYINGTVCHQRICPNLRQVLTDTLHTFFHAINNSTMPITIQVIMIHSAMTSMLDLIMIVTLK